MKKVMMVTVSHSIYDCVVVGAGPAGSTAMRHLARAGARVAGIDKASFPRHKPCGGAISAMTERQLDFEWEDLIEASLHKVDVAHKYGPPLHVNTDRPFARFVMRDRFDHRLLTVAKEEGAEFFPDHAFEDIEINSDHVVIQTSKGTMKARFIIGADGTNSVVARKIGRFYEDRGIAIEGEIKAPPELLDRYSDMAYVSFGDPSYGYGWIFPKAEKLSVGVGTFSAKRQPIKENFGRFLHEMGLEGLPMDVYGHPIPVGGSRHSLFRERVLLVGDAAGLNDPLSGEGIAHAVKSGHIAANHVMQNLSDDSIGFDAYEREVEASITSELSKAKWIADKLYRFPGILYSLLKNSPSTLELYFRLIRGEVAYGDVTRELRSLFMRFNLFKTNA